MKRVMAVAVLLFLALQATGLEEALAPRECERTCPGDGPDGSCAPFCSDCACCPALRSFVQPEWALAAPMDCRMSPAPEPSSLPTKPRPSDIFHVPRPSLA